MEIRKKFFVSPILFKKGEKMNSKDICVGKKFGRWTVLEINVYNPNSKAKKPLRMAKCKCECGTVRYKEYRDLYSGRSLSCGCLRGEQLTIRNKKNSSVKVGNIYGFLEVTKDLGFKEQTRGRKESWYLCNCRNCGRKNFEVSGNNLQAGNTKSCGCISSYGEKIISQILQENNINFCSQYVFKDLVSSKGYPLKFDFAIFKDNKLSYLIEFDGRQHYIGPDGTWKNSYNLEELQERDKLKNEYCKKNNITLKRIPYFLISKININSIEGAEFDIKNKRMCNNILF